MSHCCLVGWAFAALEEKKGGQSPPSLQDGCLSRWECAILAGILKIKIYFISTESSIRELKFINYVQVSIPPRLGLMRVILLLFISKVPRRFKKGKFSSFTISLSDKSIVSNWSCKRDNGTHNHQNSHFPVQRTIFLLKETCNTKIENACEKWQFRFKHASNDISSLKYLHWGFTNVNQ